MTDQFTPRTVAIVALASLVTGFVVVFGGGMLALRPRAGEAPREPMTAEPAAPVAPAARDGGAAIAARPSSPGDAAVASPSPEDPGAAGGGSEEGDAAPGSSGGAGSVTLGPLAVSRCFDQGNPTALASAACDRLTGLEAHFAAKRGEIAACARGHGRLAMIFDFRVSTNFARAWGGPSSTIPDAGTVAACVRRVTAPLPLATMPHAHDRYIAVQPIEW